MNTNMRNTEAGFTLIETLFVLFLFTLICTLTMPTFAASSQRRVEQQFSDEVGKMLETARLLAITQEKNWKVLLSSNSLILQESDSGRKLRTLLIPDQCIWKHNFRDGQVLFRQMGHAVGGTLNLSCTDGYQVDWKVQVGSGRMIQEDYR